jgi:hypothetical protein
VFFRLPLWLPLPHSFLCSGRCSSWRVSLFCSPRSVIPQSWLHLPPKTPLWYSLHSWYLFVGVSHHLVFCSPAVAHAVMVCHIFCSSLFHVGIAVFAFIPHVTFHASHSYCQPHARAVIHSLISFHFATITFMGYVFPNAIILVPTPHDACSGIRFQHHTHNPFSFFSLPFHYFRSFLPALALSNALFEQKMRQTSRHRHPATALCAFCVRGIRSTRIGSHTTHRLHTSFRFSTLAFQPCYPY